jgi:uncharacterized OB-fold protein
MTEIAQEPPTGSFQLSTDSWTKPFWDAVGRRELVACRCGNCGAFRMPPTPFCPTCLSQMVTWPRLSGHGELYTFTIVRRVSGQATEARLPFVPAVIALPDADGVRLVSNIIDTPISALRIGMPVIVRWSTLIDGTVLPRFVVRG